MKTIGFGCALLLAVSLAPARANAERGSDSERKVTIQAPQVNTCKSGCASITRPDSPKEDKFTRLFRRFAGEKLLPGSEALETLLFFGPETRKRLAEGAGKELPATHRSFLSRELSRTHATLWIRIVDRKEGARLAWAETGRDRPPLPFSRRQGATHSDPGVQRARRTRRRATPLDPVLNGGSPLCGRTVVHGSRRQEQMAEARDDLD